MPSALLLPVVTCAVVLLVSGVAKLRDPASVDRAFTALEVPRPVDGHLVRRLLPWVEVALGTWLLLATGPALVVVATLALVLFLAYLVLVARAVRRPEPVDCGCFGALGDDRVTRVTVWRNASLVLAALLSVLAGLLGHGVISTLAEGSAVAWLAMTVLAVVVAVLVTHRSPATQPPSGAATAGAEVDENGDYVRRPTPVVALLDEQGTLFPLHQETMHAAHLLVFLSPGCGPCSRIAPLVPGWVEDLAPIRVKAVLIGQPTMLQGDLAVLRGHAWFDPYAVGRVALGLSTPAAVLLGTDGKLAGGPALGEQDLLDFVAEVRAHVREAVATVDAPVDAPVEVSDAP